MRDTIRLLEGELVGWRDENWRILHVEDFDRVLATRISDGRHDFLWIKELTQPIGSDLGESPPEMSEGKEIGPGSLNPNQSRLAKRKVRAVDYQDQLAGAELRNLGKALEEFKEIQTILKSNRDQRKELIEILTKKYGYTQSSAYRRIAIVRVHGNPAALLRAVRSDLGGARVQGEVQAIIRECLKKYRYVPEARTIPDVLEFINGECAKKGLSKISISTLYKYEKETTYKDKLKAQGRYKEAKDTFRPKVGHLPDNNYPLAIIQVDHTPLQICFVDEIDRLPIGDAWLTLVIDTYSRMVLGFYLSFDAPSTLSTGLALAHAFLPKEEYLQKVGVRGEWPCWGFPDVVLVDNAVELNGHMMHGARSKFRFTLRDRPVGSPNFGGHVESAFKTFMFELKSIPGTKFSNPVERAEYDSEGRAIFTIREFETLFTEFLVNDYHLGKHRGDGMDKTVPLLKWKQGIFEGDVMPPVGLPERPVDALEIKLSLMPVERRVVRNATVSLFDETYHSGALVLISDKVDPKKTLVERKFEIRYDPRNIEKIWLKNDQISEYVELTFADARKMAISLWEHRARKRGIEDASKQFDGHRYESKLRREDMKQSAAKVTKQKRLEREKEHRRAADAIVKPAVTGTPKPSPAKHVMTEDTLQALREKLEAINRRTEGGSK